MCALLFAALWAAIERTRGTYADRAGDRAGRESGNRVRSRPRPRDQREAAQPLLALVGPPASVALGGGSVLVGVACSAEGDPVTDDRAHGDGDRQPTENRHSQGS